MTYSLLFSVPDKIREELHRPGGLRQPDSVRVTGHRLATAPNFPQGDVEEDTRSHASKILPQGRLCQTIVDTHTSASSC